MKSLVVGLARHAETEAALPGASFGTHLLFSMLEQSLCDKCSLRLLPARYYRSDASGAVELAEDLLSEVDALIVSLPPHPIDLEALFLVRRTLARRVPFVYLPLGEFPRGAWFYRHTHRHLGPADLISFSSTADRAVYDALVRTSAARVRVVPFGIDPGPYRSAVDARAVTRRHLGVGDDEVVFVIHGRVEPQKNVHAAAAVFGQVARRHRTCALWLVGPISTHDSSAAVEASPSAASWPMPRPRLLSHAPIDPYLDAILASLEGYGTDRVLWWGQTPHEHIPTILAAADVSLNLTLNRDENFGFSTVEAMAAGLPVIGTDWGGLHDTVADGVTGYRVPTVVTDVGVALDHWFAAQRALDLAHDVSGRRRMGTAAIARVGERYTIDRFTDQLLAEIRKLLSQVRPVRPHRWTTLGQALVQQYSFALSGLRGGSFPVPLPPTPRPQDEAMVRAILTPYATRCQDDQPDPQSVFLPSSVLMTCDAATVVSADPIYGIHLDLLDPVAVFVVRTLVSTGPLAHDTLVARAADGGVGAKAVSDALRQLLTAGIVLQSDAPQSRWWSEEDQGYVDPRNRR
jgi:glycosyltransferase involved in cell wall biosynthesis